MQTNDNAKAGLTFETRAEYEAHKAQVERVKNPQAPKRSPLAVKVIREGRSIMGRPGREGEIILIWPDEIPPGFLTKQQAQEVIDMGLATMASPEEIEAFLAANEETPNA